MRRDKLTRRETLNFYIYILPWLIGFVLFHAGPLIGTFFISLTDWSILRLPKFIGWKNYQQLFRDPLFWQSLKVSAIYTAALPLRLAIALIIAVLLNQKIRGLSVFRTVYYLPILVAGVPLAVLWSWIFSPNFGFLNNFLAMVGIEGPRWMYSEFWVMPAFIIMSMWQFGENMVIYLASLQGIPNNLYEVAELDGASSWAKFWNITFPMITPVIFFTLIMGIIRSFQVFAQAYIMTAGGPHNASLFYVLYVYRHAFQFFNMGYATSLAWMLFLIVLGLTIVIFKTSGRWVYYRGAP